MEGLLGRIVGDVLIHYLNLAGAYIVCATVSGGRAVSLDRFLLRVACRSGRRPALPLWSRSGTATRTGRTDRAKRKMQKELEKRRAARPTVTAQLVPARSAAVACATSMRLSRSGPPASSA